MIEIASVRNRKALEKGRLAVGYLLAGFPQKDSFLEILACCEAAGLDIFEIGYPSDNPVADGEVIRQAHASADLSVSTDISYWKRIRESVDRPVWVMAYKKDLIDTGFYKALARDGLADALVIPDATYEQRCSLLNEMKPMGIDVLGFVNPDMDIAEQEACFEDFALVYQQLYSGPTGMTVVTDNYRESLMRARKHKHLRVFAGFGIATPERAAQLLEDGFDGVVIGTAMMSKLNTSKEVLASFVEELGAAVRKGR
jgi:tryptophan synthase alpha chain